MLQNMLQLAMSSVDEIEERCSPELYPSCRKAKDYIRETSMLIGANVSIWPQIVAIEANRELQESKTKGESERTEQKSSQLSNSGKQESGSGQLEKVGRLRYVAHLIRKVWRKRA
jgi:hypothetical protein